MSESFAEMFEASIAQTNMRIGEIITGEVVDINRDVVVVNAGLKSEGVIPVEQFFNEANNQDDLEKWEKSEVAIKISDVIDHYLLSSSKKKRFIFSSRYL